MIRFVCLLLVLVLRSGLAQWGGELRLNVRSEPRTLHPALADDDASEMIRYLTGGVLVRVNRITQQAEPSLASSWRVLDGGRAIRFQLREKLQFSDGTPFTSDDVVYTIETIMNPDLHSPVGDSFRMGGRVQATADGPLSVVVRFPEPLAGGPALFDQVAIMSRKAPAKEAAVLGPFYIAGRKAGAWVRLERNLKYWKVYAGRRLPYLDAIQLDIQPSRDAEFLRFRRGELHMLPALEPEQFDELSKTGAGLVRDAGSTLANEFLWFNMAPAAPLPAYKKAWFASKNFRRAVSSAIRREDLCTVVFRGHAVPAVGPFPPVNRFWFNSKLKAPSFDLDAARRFLAQDGFSASGGVLRDCDNHPVEFSVVSNAGNKSRERMAAMIQQDLAAIGIRLNIVTLDFPSLLDRISKSQQYESCLLGLNNVDLDPDGQMNFWLSSSAQHCWNPRQTTPATPWEAEIDRLMREQAGQPDARRRKALFDRVQEIVWDQTPVIYLVNRNALVAVAPGLRNVQPAVLDPRLVWNIDQIHFALQK